MCKDCRWQWFFHLSFKDWSCKREYLREWFCLLQRLPWWLLACLLWIFLIDFSIGIFLDIFWGRAMMNYFNFCLKLERHSWYLWRRYRWADFCSLVRWVLVVFGFLPWLILIRKTVLNKRWDDQAKLNLNNSLILKSYPNHIC